ncbi:MAG TPA: glycosyltransferase [Thermoanaerobaculia bacterium]|nr:glycosyltransferase [Thermoanaerobaculia bacterium]
MSAESDAGSKPPGTHPDTPARRTVVFVTAVTGHGGPNASLRVVLPRLPGIEPVVVGPYGDEESVRWRAEGVAVEQMPRPKGARARTRAMWRLFQVLRSRRAERPLVWVNGLTEAAVAAPALWLLRLGGLVWIHNYEVPRVARATSPLLRLLARRRRHRLRLAAVSSVAAAVGREVFGDGAEVAALPNPIEQTALRAIERGGRGDGRLRVAYVAGTDRFYKGFDLLPEIVTATGDGGIDWMIVAAEGKQPQAWRRLREVATGLTDSKVTLRGRSERVEELYAWVDVVLIPSRQESFCRVAAEAMAAGCAVVASRLPAIEEVCGDVAWFFEREDAAGAGALLRRLAGAPEEVAEAGRRGRVRAERFATDGVVAEAAALLAAG